MSAKKPQKPRPSGTMGRQEAAWLHHFQTLGVRLRWQLEEGEEIVGRLTWFDRFAFGLVRGEGNEVTVLRHAVQWYEPLEEVAPLEVREWEVPADQENERYHRYRQQRAVLRFHLVEGQVLEGSLKWYDRYAVKLRPTDRGPDVTVHKHAVRYYEVGAPESRRGSPGQGEEA